MNSTDPRRDNHPISRTKVIDDAGAVWWHSNPAELYRWVCRRNELLRTIAHAPRGVVECSH
jgi:hypothetical protein